jgi:2-polyprenyl-3-methyl-5-hydroxy-6-metoxy-1,4-benzoquinol methylase
MMKLFLSMDLSKITMKDLDKKYDAISCISSLEHYYNPNIVLNKFKNLLILDGILILEVPDTLNPKAQLAEFFSFEHLSHFTKRFAYKNH